MARSILNHSANVVVVVPVRKPALIGRMKMPDSLPLPILGRSTPGLAASSSGAGLGLLRTTRTNFGAANKVKKLNVRNEEDCTTGTST